MPKLKFVPQDLWIGLYWTRVLVIDSLGSNEKEYIRQDLFVTTWYLCLIPCLPIIWITYKEAKNLEIKNGKNKTTD